MIATIENQELPDLKWKLPSEAFQWAQETASRPNIKNPLANMSSQIISGSENGWSSEDYRDLAFSILTVVANIKERRAREVFRYIYGTGIQRQIPLSEVFGKILAERYPKKSYGQLRRLAEVSLMKARYKALGRKSFGLEMYARAVGIQRPSLYSGDWQMIIRDAEMDIALVLNHGEMLAHEAISKLEVMV